METPCRELPLISGGGGISFPPCPAVLPTGRKRGRRAADCEYSRLTHPARAVAARGARPRPSKRSIDLTVESARACIFVRARVAEGSFQHEQFQTPRVAAARGPRARRG